jgi:hypothetical protein
MVNTFDTTAQTISIQGISRGTSGAAKTIKRPTATRIRLTRESPTENPTSFESS